MADLAAVAAGYNRALLAHTVTVVRNVTRSWSKFDVSAIDESWPIIRPSVVASISAAQLFGASLATVLDHHLLRDAGLTRLGPALRPQGFVGVSGTGAPFDLLLDLAPIRVKQAIAAGIPPDMATGAGLSHLIGVGDSELQESSRGALDVVMNTDEQYRGFLRHPNPGACGRCLILANRFYRRDADFLRHPRCFPAGVVVSGPATQAATRRWYKGELTIIRTASGKHLPVTGNHPVLTVDGWTPAHLLDEGDEVIGSAFVEGAQPLVVPDEHQMPARVEDLWRPDEMLALLGMPTTAEDFHGDGGHGKVDVVLADGLLRGRGYAALLQEIEKLPLALGPELASALDALCTLNEKLVALLDTAYGSVGGGSVRLPLLGSHAGIAEPGGLRLGANGDAFFEQPAPYGRPTEAEIPGNLQFAGAREVRRDDVATLDWPPVGSRWDAAPFAVSIEDRRANASRGRDLGNRLSGQVEIDRVVDVERVAFAGHVFSLQTAEGWHSANGLIVSNCRCTAQPVLVGQDFANVPTALDRFKQLSPAEQDKAFSPDGAEAIRRGGDPAQVVNAARGMSAAGSSFTREGTRRGAYAGGRLSPTGCRKQAGGDQGRYVALLRANGYVI